MDSPGYILENSSLQTTNRIFAVRESTYGTAGIAAMKQFSSISRICADKHVYATEASRGAM